MADEEEPKPEGEGVVPPHPSTSDRPREGGDPSGASEPDVQAESPLPSTPQTPAEQLQAQLGSPPSRGRSGWGGFKKFVREFVLVAFLLAVVFPVVLVVVYRFVPPPITYLMVERAVQGKGLDYRWKPLKDISPALVQAAVASEDARFCEHHGFDFEAIEKAMKNNARGRKVRGGSTISQQTAKNVFLWPQRSWVRKGLEAYFTVLIETLWGKKRIMEVYLNVAEMGPGTYGAQAAAKRYFKTDAKKLTRAQSARIVAILPSPLRYKPVNSGPYVQRRSRSIGGAMGTVRDEGLAACVLKRT